LRVENESEKGKLSEGDGRLVDVTHHH